MENGQTYLVVYKDDKSTERAKELEFSKENETHYIFINRKIKDLPKEEGVLRLNVIRWQEV